MCALLHYKMMQTAVITFFALNKLISICIMYRESYLKFDHMKQREIKSDHTR